MSQLFFYKAMDNNGHVIQGQLNADNINNLEARLERMELYLIHYHTKKTRNYRVGKVTRQELITFTFYMENLTRAGVPLIEGLEDLRDSLPQSRFKEIISSLIESIEGGAKLSDAMSNFPETFDQVFTNLINAGEESGNLATVFKHMTDSLKWNDEMIAKTKKMLMYPAFMGIVIISVLFFLMIYLVPQLINFVKSVGTELPFHTKMLFYISDIFVNYWYIILMVPVIVFLLIKSMAKISPSFCFAIDNFKLRVWVIGPILQKIILARFATFFALLYSSGITVLDSLDITKKLANNLVIEDALQQVRNNVSEGISISESFEKTHLFPPLVLRMVAIGEATGELDNSLLNVSYFYDREVKDSIDKMQTIIEPMMTVILGLLLGWVIMSVLGPIYDSIASFEQAKVYNPTQR